MRSISFIWRILVSFTPSLPPLPSVLSPFYFSLCVSFPFFLESFLSAPSSSSSSSSEYEEDEYDVGVFCAARSHLFHYFVHFKFRLLFHLRVSHEGREIMIRMRMSMKMRMRRRWRTRRRSMRRGWRRRENETTVSKEEKQADGDGRRCCGSFSSFSLVCAFYISAPLPPPRESMQDEDDHDEDEKQ